MMLSNCSCSTQPDFTEPVGPETWSYEIGHANIPEGNMTISINNGPNQSGSFLALHHAIASGKSWPATFSIYSSGYMRLVPVTEPATHFGTSVILGPAYWSGYMYFHNPKIDTVHVEGDLQDADVITITALGHLGSLDVEYTIHLSKPSDELVSCKVTQVAKWCENVTINANRLESHQGFKLFQFSSMFVDGNYHDANSARYNSAYGFVATELSNNNGLVFSNPNPLGEPWLEVAHTDTDGWQGATPSVLVALDNTAFVSEYTPQGWVTQTQDENDDNVGVWLNWDSSPTTYKAGDKITSNYTITASCTPHSIPVE